jgi:hypothetical protein
MASLGRSACTRVMQHALGEQQFVRALVRACHVEPLDECCRRRPLARLRTMTLVTWGATWSCFRAQQRQRGLAGHSRSCICVFDTPCAIVARWDDAIAMAKAPIAINQTDLMHGSTNRGRLWLLRTTSTLAHPPCEGACPDVGLSQHRSCLVHIQCLYP